MYTSDMQRSRWLFGADESTHAEKQRRLDPCDLSYEKNIED